jgi:hypothetical protein
MIPISMRIIENYRVLGPSILDQLNNGQNISRRDCFRKVFAEEETRICLKVSFFMINFKNFQSPKNWAPDYL